MGIAPYKTFTFDGESSGDYGVYITGTGVFNAPERSVEMVEIAGRNGSFALDKGKFENIEVKYKVGIVDDSESDFADRVSDFRNWLCSKVGYCRLEDEYNPNEYRMGVYSSGVELEHDLLIAGEAEITFNCKPQRWLTSGETAVAVADGGTLDNPTLFPSSPLLEVYGYGKINIGNSEIVLDSGGGLIGETLIVNKKSYFGQTDVTVTFAPCIFMSGDSIYSLDSGGLGMVTVSIYTDSANGWFFDDDTWHNGFVFYPLTESDTFSANTAQTYTKTATKTVDIYNESAPGSLVSATITVTFVVAYDGDESISFTLQNVSFGGGGGSHLRVFGNSSVTVNNIYVNSTASPLGNPTYIDLDIGEVYNMDFGYIVSVNDAATLPSDLPTLPNGATKITYENTVTKLDIVPRWWKV